MYPTTVCLCSLLSDSALKIIFVILLLGYFYCYSNQVEKAAVADYLSVHILWLVNQNILDMVCLLHVHEYSSCLSPIGNTKYSGSVLGGWLKYSHAMGSEHTCSVSACTQYAWDEECVWHTNHVLILTFDIPVQLLFTMQIVKALQNFSNDSCNVEFFKCTSLHLMRNKPVNMLKLLTTVHQNCKLQIL